MKYNISNFSFINCVFVIVLENLCPFKETFWWCDGSAHYLDCSNVYPDIHTYTKIFCCFGQKVPWFQLLNLGL